MAKHGTELYLIRHGESETRAEANIIGGCRNEAPLTGRGVEQAKALGRYLLEQNIVPTQVYASSAIRNIKTAEYSLGVMGLSLGVVVEEALQGWNEGDWVGMQRNEVYTDATLAKMAQLGIEFAPPGGESMHDIGTRVMNWAHAKLGAFEVDAPAERIFAYSHGITIGCAVGVNCEWAQSQIDEAKIPNASLTLLTSNEFAWQLEYIGKVPYTS